MAPPRRKLVHVKLQFYFSRFKRKFKLGADAGLYRVSALIRREARESLRLASGASPPGRPPHAHTTGGLREINFSVNYPEAIIGPRKFPRSNFFDRPVPNIHEFGGIAVAAGFRRRYAARYPERSFMWAAVKSLKSRNRIEPEFNITLKRRW